MNTVQNTMRSRPARGIFRAAALPLALAWLICLGAAVAAPYPAGGKLTMWVQPNGTRLALRVVGDEFYARTVTTTQGHGK